ncbi:MAG TPA: acyl-CoA synthetase [Acidimicrobiales bacterium]|nr:acyl-CoA synthetase [Acidimicrobiales bacterium]
MYPRVHAATNPDKPALIMGTSGEVVTYGQLEDRSNRLAQAWFAAGLRPGDHVAALLENHVIYLEVAWAALRSGLYLTSINRYLTAEEAAYIVDDCGARAFVSSKKLADVATGVLAAAPKVEVALMVDGAAPGFGSYEDALAASSPEPLADEPLGEFMLYSSGTTGKPKGIVRPLSGRNVSEGDLMMAPVLSALFGFDENSVYLSPAPMYHSAPLGFSFTAQALGGTVVMMERFDAEDALRLVEQHRVTHSQWVPTMFIRMLKLPEAVRTKYDLSSMTTPFHGAAPCPVPVKEQMLEWWGPSIREYYGGTEGNGFAHITGEEWLAHKGSVGIPLLGVVHICDDDGTELPVGETGTVYFERPTKVFEYHNDAEKTRSAQHPAQELWTTMGDVGRVDEDGYLYLTDRKSFTIISGGINIYPQEIEDALVMHPAVLDAAVIGVPNEDFGEEVKAVLELMDGVAWSDELAADLDSYCRDRLAAFKVPRSYDVMDELPRLPTGKLYKRVLRDAYWAAADA